MSHLPVLMAHAHSMDTLQYRHACSLTATAKGATPFVPSPAGYRVWWMQDHQFRDPVVIVRCQAYTGAVAATARDRGVCMERGRAWREGEHGEREGMERDFCQGIVPLHLDRCVGPNVN